MNQGIISLIDILRWFWESHDPTEDHAEAQFRSGLYYNSLEQKEIMEMTRQACQSELQSAKGSDRSVRTEILAAASFQNAPGDVFYYAEEEHQQYLAKQGSPASRASKGRLQPLAVSFRVGNLELLQEHAPKLPEEFWQRHTPAAVP